MSNNSADHLAGAGKQIEPAATIKAECVFIGKAVSPKIELDLAPTSRGSFCGHGDFEINGQGYSAMLILMPQKVGNIFARRNGKHVVYSESGE